MGGSFNWFAPSFGSGLDPFRVPKKKTFLNNFQVDLSPKIGFQL